MQMDYSQIAWDCEEALYSHKHREDQVDDVHWQGHVNTQLSQYEYLTWTPTIALKLRPIPI